jgi:predicted Zn-dependent peptidase
MFRRQLQIHRSTRLFSGVVSQTSVLSNGIRVNSIEVSGSAQSFVSACVHAGSRHESDATSGSLRFLERIFYLSSAQKSTKQMLQSMAALGGNGSLNLLRIDLDLFSEF